MFELINKSKAFNSIFILAIDLSKILPQTYQPVQTKINLFEHDTRDTLDRSRNVLKRTKLTQSRIEPVKFKLNSIMADPQDPEESFLAA